MKKCISGFLAAVTLALVIFTCGCSDFRFNPIGSWEYHEEIYYLDGKEVSRVEKEEMPYGGMTYIFEKSGTGYIDVDGYRSMDFTYDYDDEHILMHMAVPDALGSPNAATHTVDVEYKVYDSTENSPAKLIRTEEYNTKDENGKTVAVKNEYILLKL